MKSIRGKIKHRLLAVLFCLLFSGFAVKGQTSLTVSDVRTVIAQAVSTAVSLNQKVTVAVTDQEGNLLGVFVMTGANSTTLIRSVGTSGQGLENLSVPATAAAHSKAGTAGIFSSGGNAFTTRTASFIIQEHFPPGIDNRPGGPLYGVQFSTLPCSDVAIAGLPLGLSGDAGGIPLYKNGVAVGGVGVEGDGLYTVDRIPTDNDQPFEEIIAVAASRGFESPAQIRADNILVEGIRLPFANVANPPVVTTIPFGSLPGTVVSTIIAAPPSDFVPATLNGISGQMSSRYPTIAGATISAAEVRQILGDAAQMANITRAAIRQPIGSNARVTMSCGRYKRHGAGNFSPIGRAGFRFGCRGAEGAHGVVFYAPRCGDETANRRFRQLCFAGKYGRHHVDRRRSRLAIALSDFSTDRFSRTE